MNLQPFPGFVGGSYQSAALRASAQRTMNLIPEVIPPESGEKAQLVLYRTSGLALQQTLGDSPGRGAIYVNGRVFVVYGQTFFELTSLTTATAWGTLAAVGTSPVELETNEVQICCIADGLGYVFTLATNAWQQITGADGFPTYAEGLATVDTYMITLSRDTNQFALSGLLDATAWSGLDVQSDEAPDNVVALAESHLYLWIFGNQKIQIFQDTGAESNPFQRVPGAQIDMGCEAAKSVAALDNTLFWLGSDSQGAGVVYRADGYLPTRISTHAVETALESYSMRSDAVAFAYEERGHLCYRLDFPTAGACWCYDVSTSLWHERGYWNAAAASYSSPLGRFHVYGFGAHILLDQTSGKVFTSSQSMTTDAGNPIRWLRAAPHVSAGDAWMFYNAFMLDMQVGGGGGTAGADPQVMIRWSDDSGFTWSNVRQVSAGAVGQYKQRVVTRRLGRARSRVFEVSGSDPIPELCLIGAYLDAQRGTS